MKLNLSAKISVREAIRLQKKLAPQVSEESELPTKIINLVGCDATYVNDRTIASATLVDYKKLKLSKTSGVEESTRFPYIPGLLAFREAPAVVHAIRCLRPKSYICLVDAHGIAHPRRFGLACFVGLALDRPTIGVAKSLLFGRVKGDTVTDNDGTTIATIIKLPESGKKIYVSVGHKISLKDAVRIVKYCLTPKGPLPIRLAHEEVTKRKCLLKRSNPVY
ncbi:MAG TPA: endonuclease V [Methylomirabilota bacterium]|nr:endonuclease V [Methylomirabilota bacterium]